MSVLGATLRAAVPMLMLSYQGRPEWRLREGAAEAADYLAHSGDVLMFKCNKKSRLAFNALARTLACCALLDPALDWLQVIAEIERAEAEAFGVGNSTG